jgi:hypothetical protein
VIVDLDPTGKTRSAGRLLMPVAILLLTLGYIGLLGLQRADADSAARSRDRLLAALAVPTTAPPARPPAGMLGPSVLAQRSLVRAALPPLLTLPADVGDALPAGSPEARREVAIAVSDTSRPTVYRLPDGRMFVVQQTLSDRGRPALVNWFEEGTVRGKNAQFYSAPVGPFRALIWWSEGPVSYYVYSATVPVRELVRFIELLR